MSKPTIIYMNHLIGDTTNRELKVPEPVMAIFRNGKITYVNEVEIMDNNGVVIATIKWHAAGLKAPVPHSVHAWIEVDEDRGYIDVK